ncbi:MAG TPA: hypothetical protein VL001_04440, partial [Candidimonas sp.]|nr:hypothetical protein [Candidimonas sp.]
AGGMAMAGLRGRSEPPVKGARMCGRTGRRGRGAQGAEQAKGPAIAMPPARDVLPAGTVTV